MHPFEFARRRLSGNIVWPYTWEARYRGGGVLKQFDTDGYHKSGDIDLSRLESLVILGHSSPIVLEVPKGPPDEAIIQADVTIHIDVRAGNGERSFRNEVTRIFGFRYGTRRYTIEIDDSGRVIGRT